MLNIGSLVLGVGAWILGAFAIANSKTICKEWEKMEFLKHLLFGEQQYGCDELQVINNDEKIGKF